ncbi:MAG: DUF362 domain-containing protein [Firmicutes bacterium]|nr:DUF362 domain-containing protein [Bacillota bacterium]
MSPASVSVVRCSGYDVERVRDAVHSVLAPLGGMESFVHPGQTVLIKPNLIGGAPPENAVTTHPAVLRAVIEEIWGSGGTPVVGESPAYESFESAARKSGLLQVMAELGVEHAPFSASREIEISPVRVIPRIPVAAPVLDADVIISLPKLKTHGLVSYTGCVKNMFGVVVGTAKAKFHLRFQDRDVFSSFLAEIYGHVKPDLSILDGILAMEGNGPRNGKPVPMGVLLAGADGVAVDAVACAAIALDPRDVPPVAIAADFGYGVDRLEDITIHGPELSEIVWRGFDVPRSVRPSLRQRAMSGKIGRALRNALTTRPSVIRPSCAGCRLCARACPAGAITIAEGKARIDLDKCIRCYCCQELCEHEAIVLSTPPLARLLR